MTDKIMKRLQENYNTVVNQGYEIVGVFLQVLVIVMTKTMSGFREE